MREFGRGMSLLTGGFGWWRRRPGLMVLGLLPVALVGAAFLAGLVALGVFLPEISVAVTPFADGWPAPFTTVIRFAVGTAVVGASLVLVAVSFTALTLLVGEPFYGRIWRAVETDAGAAGIDVDYGFWSAAGDTLALFARGAGIAIVAALTGLVPVVGGILGTVFAVLMTGWLLADELTSRALSARGLDRAARRKLLRRHRARALGFGVATQLCFMIPLGAIVIMPAAVAGSTLLAHSLLDSASPKFQRRATGAVRPPG